MCDLNSGFYNMMGGFGSGMMGGGWLGFGLGWIFMIVFWALIIWLIVFVVRKLSGHDSFTRHEHKENAMELLKKRYAKGEIDKQEFEEKKKTLES